MGNIELCPGTPESENDDLIVIGHMKNSQTRALLSILAAANIKYDFNKIDLPKPLKNNL